MTPSARSLAAGRANGWLIDVVERWIGGGRIRVRKDLFGFLDLVVDLCAVYATTGIAALELGLGFAGAEVDPATFIKGAERLKRHLHDAAVPAGPGASAA